MKTLIYKKQNNVAVLSLNRPQKFNALNGELLKELNIFLDEIGRDEQIRLLTIDGGESNCFCSGVDLEELHNFRSIEEARRFALLFDETMTRLLKFGKPVVAVMRGLAYGGGFALASAADLRIATNDIRISFPAGRLGAILPPALTCMLNALVGIGTSRDLLMTGRAVEAEEALSLGLVNRLETEESIAPRLQSEIDAILKSSDTALEMTRRITNQQLIVEIEKYNLTGAENFAYLSGTEEWQKRVARFFERRKKTK